MFNSNEEVNVFYKDIHSLLPNIKKEDPITFLDVNKLKSQGKIEINWHLKSTNTGTYLHENSCSPTNHKVSAMRSLINRAYRICSTNELFEKSFKLIDNIFINNGYHFSFINKIKNKVIQTKQYKSIRKHRENNLPHIQLHQRT